MSLAISVRKMGKRYFIRRGESRVRPLLREVMTERLKNPFKRRVQNPIEEFWAIRNFDLDVNIGDRVALIGANGAGKSTVLKILSRLTQPSEGEARIRGRMASLLEVNTGFHPSLTGRENIFLKAAIHGMPRSEVRRRFDEIVDFSGVEKFLDTPIKYYSSGMYVRLGFAVAAHLEPDILIVDEVLAVGDASFQQKCLGKMSATAREGRTILFVSHNMPAVRSLCNRAIVLESGRKIFDGSSYEGVNSYLSALGTVKAEQVWVDPGAAPKNELFQLRAVRIRDDSGAIMGRLPNDKLFSIEVDYSIVKDSTIMGVTTILTNYDGEILFSSISNHEPRWHAKPRPVGDYRSVCTVPGDLLSEGSYRVTILLWGPGYSSSFTEADVNTFEIYDTGSLRGDYFGGWSGSIKPRLEWQCERIET